ncbi:MAG TPA: hypothetical protein VFQ53_04945 [Kofleriaceae bacterium]|nr:hypothetical protein [Kofleriaceae bacterium]
MLLVACGDGGNNDPVPDSAPPVADAPAAGFSVEGTIDVANPPAGAKLAVLWVVSSGSPDTVVKFGETVPTGTTFVLGLASDPPANAINSDGLAVGLLALFAPDAALPPDGTVVTDPDALEPKVLGLGEDAVIWRGPGTGQPAWTAPFPHGYSCGKCVRATTETFDTFTPAACAISVAASHEPCNWT